jgi:hypothetical protein
MMRALDNKTPFFSGGPSSVWIVLIMLAVFWSGETSAQAWRPATVVMSSGDSVRGEVNFSDPDISPSEIVFRKQGQPESSTLSTEEVQLFIVQDPATVFEKFEANIAYYTTVTIMEGVNPIVAREDISVFAERLIYDEHVILYSVQDKNKDERFFIRKEGKTTELLNISYQVYKNGVTNVVEDFRYAGQVRQLLSDCRPGKMGNIAYTPRNLTRHVATYIECKGGKSQKVTQSLGERFSIGVTTSYTDVLTPRGVDYIGSLAGGSMQFLSRKNLNNRFFWIDVSAVGNAEDFGPVMVSLMGGTYFGSGDIQPLAGIGLSMVGGGVVAGAGVAYKKRIILNGNLRLHLGGVGYELRVALLPKLWGYRRS